MAWLLCGLTFVAHAADGNSLLLASTPAGATVCRKVLDREECLGKTPLNVSLDPQSGSTPKFIFKKLGYRSQQLYVDPTGPVSVTLQKSAVLPDEASVQDASLRGLQRTVSERLSRLIYGSRLADDGRLEVLGPNAVVRTPEAGTSLRFAIAIGDYQLLRKLKAAGRARGEQRFAKCLEVFKEAGAFEFFDEIRRSLAGVPLDRISFDVMYVRSGSYLDFEERQQWQSRWVGTRYTSTEQIDTYVMYVESYDVTVIRDDKTSVSYSFQVDKTAGAVGLAQQLGTVPIMTNDTGGGRYVRLDNAKLLQSMAH